MRYKQRIDFAIVAVVNPLLGTYECICIIWFTLTANTHAREKSINVHGKKRYLHEAGAYKAEHLLSWGISRAES